MAPPECRPGNGVVPAGALLSEAWKDCRVTHIYVLWISLFWYRSFHKGCGALPADSAGKCFWGEHLPADSAGKCFCGEHLPADSAGKAPWGGNQPFGRPVTSGGFFRLFLTFSFFQIFFWLFSWILKSKTRFWGLECPWIVGYDDEIGLFFGEGVY